jgi:hypothetical protein
VNEITRTTTNLSRHKMTDSAVESLAEEFARNCSRATVEALFRATLEQFRDARITAYVPILALRYTREHLRSVSRAPIEKVNGRIEALFVSQESAWSQLAAALFNRQTAGRFLGSAAGVRADAQLCAKLSTAGAPSGFDCDLQPISSSLVESASVIVTLQRGDACPVLPGRAYVHWSMPELPDDSMESIRRRWLEIERRLELLIQSCEASSAA